MKKITKHQAYVGIVGLALAALAFDRGFSGPSVAQATPVVAEVVSNHVAAVVVAKTNETSLTARLHAILGGEALDANAVSNAFAPSKAWTGNQQTAAGQAVRTADDFQKTHTLSAVMESSRGGQAIINGKLVRQGETLDGYKLTTISRDGVRMVGANAQVELRIGR